MNYLSCLIFFSQLLLFPFSASSQTRSYILNSGEWEIHGILTTPDTTEYSQVPMVIMTHTMWGGDKSQYETTAEVFREYGIASFRLDLRGHGESINNGKLERGEVTPSLVFEAWPDIIKAHQFAESLDWVDTTKIGFIGASYSGDLVAKAGRNYKFGKAYVILSSGMFSLKSMIWMRFSDANWHHFLAKDDHTFAPQTVGLIKERGWAETTIYDVGGHATAMLNNIPSLNTSLAEWFLSEFNK
jgi:dienelactone hydrolase